MRIQSVTARQLLDCKTRPLVEVEVRTESGHVGRGAAPTGTTVGVHEAFVLRDNDPASYGGRSVHRAVEMVHDVIAPALIGLDVSDQRAIDTLMIELDGTSNKSRLGANSIYSTSIAVLRAAAAATGLPTYLHLREQLGLGPLSTVPVPSFNMVNGGRYGDVTQPFSEFLVIPHRAGSIYEAIEASIHLFDVLEETMTKRLGRSPQVARSYGYVAPSSDPRVVMELLSEAVENAGLADVMAFALDCASSEMYDANNRTYELNGARVSSEELIDFARQLTEDYPFVFIEDLLDEDDWDGFATASPVAKRTLLVGDDLIVTDKSRLQRAIDGGLVSGFVLKPNQVGTITEALDCHALAEQHGVISVPSGRSGGVVDDVVMDLSVGLEVPFQKNGAPRSGERIEKLNFLMRAAEGGPEGRVADLSGIVRF